MVVRMGMRRSLDLSDDFRLQMGANRLPDNVGNHPVATNSIDFNSRATRDSACNILLSGDVSR